MLHFLKGHKFGPISGRVLKQSDFGIKKHDIRIVSGETSNRKIVEIDI